MEPLFAYFIKMFICSALLLGYYWLALRNERFHQWNRFYLMAAMLLSIVVPFFHLPIMVKEEPTMVVTMVSALPWNTVVKPDTFKFDWRDALMLTGIVVSAIMLLQLITSLLRIYRMYKRYEHSSFNDVSVVITEDQTAPFSFFKWLFWRQDIDPDSENGKRMLQHELTHISEKHSTDKLITELVLIVFWMNPFFWIIRRELFAIHEFLADQKAIQQHDGAAFAAMILQAVHPSSTPALSNPFFTSQIKRRLVMITTSHAPKYSYLRRISGFVLMITTTLLLILTIEKVQAQKTPKAEKAPKAEKTPTAATPAVPAAPAVNALPDSINSLQVWDNNGDCMYTYHMKDGRTIKMKMTDAKKKGYPMVVPPPAPPAPLGALAPIQPEVVVPGTPMPAAPAAPATPDVPAASEWEKAAKGNATVIQASAENLRSLQLANNENDKDPMIIYAGLKISKAQMNELEPKNIYLVSVLKGEAAVKQYGDAGKNGVIIITPKNTAYTERPDKNASIVVTGYKTQTPIYIVDGKRISEAQMKELSPNTIESINVLKGESATSKYGEDGNNGAVEIRLKEGKAGNGSKESITIEDKVFTSAETMPSFPGGQEGWRRYLSQTLRYPAKAQNAGTQGVAVVKFIVEPDGNLSNFSIAQDPGEGLGEEALRLLKQSPKWIPAEQNGHIVRAEVRQTITFRLE